MDKTWHLGVYNRTASISLLKFASHESKEQKLRKVSFFKEKFEGYLGNFLDVIPSLFFSLE